MERDETLLLSLATHRYILARNLNCAFGLSTASLFFCGLVACASTAAAPAMPAAATFITSRRVCILAKYHSRM